MTLIIWSIGICNNLKLKNDIVIFYLLLESVRAFNRLINSAFISNCHKGCDCDVSIPQNTIYPVDPIINIAGMVVAKHMFYLLVARDV